MKRNRWLVISVLVVAVGAFLALSLLPLLAGRGDRSTATAPTEQVPESSDARAKLEETARGYELVLEREPENQVALEELVKARVQLGDLEGIIEPLEKLSELNPDPRYRVLLGQAKQELGDLEGAAQAYRTVLTSNPGNMNALQALVALLIEQERPQAAIGLLQDTLQTASQANEISPGTIDVMSVQLLLAQVYVEDDKIDEALRLYDEAIANAGDDFRPLLAKALVLRDVNKEAEAAILFQKAEELAPAQFKDQVRQLATGSQGQEAPTAATEDGPAASEESAPEANPSPNDENEADEDEAASEDSDNFVD